MASRCVRTRSTIAIGIARWSRPAGGTWRCGSASVRYAGSRTSMARRDRMPRRSRCLPLHRREPPPGAVEGQGSGRNTVALVRRRRRLEPPVSLRPVTEGREVVETIAPSSCRCAAIRSASCASNSTRCASCAARISVAPRRPQCRGRRRHPRAPAAGLGQKRRVVRHDRGRDRHRQRHPLARPVRDLQAPGNVIVDDRDAGRPAEGRRGHPCHLRPDHRA